MPGMTAEQIYSMLVEQAKGRSALDAGFGVSWHARENLADRAVQIVRLSAKIEQSWKGDAAGGAQRGLGPITSDLDAAAADHNTAQDLMNRQMNDFATARDSVVKVPPQPTMQDPAAPMVNGESPSLVEVALRKSAMETQTVAYNSAAQNNVQVYNTYHGTSSENISSVPQESPRLQLNHAPVHLSTHPSSCATGAGGGSHHVDAGAGGSQPAAGSPSHSIQGTGDHVATGGQVGNHQLKPENHVSPERPVPGSGTSAAAANPSTAVPEPGTRPGYVPPAAGLGQGEGSATRSPSFGPTGGFSGGTGGGPAGGTGGAGRISDVLGGRGAAGAGASGPGARGGGAAMGTGGQARGAAGAADAAASRSAGPTGRGGGPAGAMPPGAGGRGGDEKEHKRKYGAPATEDELFGDGAGDETPTAAPPVLGAIRQPGEKKQP